MNALDRTKFGPPDDTPILPWYAGAFSHAFVALHPFFTVEGLNPAQCEHGTLIVDCSDVPMERNLLDWLDEHAAQQRRGKELDRENVARIAKRFGTAISWRSIVQQAGFADHCVLDRALRTSIGGLRHDLADAAASEHLAAFCDRRSIFVPTEGTFQPRMQATIAALFRRMGLERVTLGDEFGDCEVNVEVAALERDLLWRDAKLLPGHDVKRVIAPDRSLLAWVHWDSFYTLFLGEGDAFRKGPVSSSFEGFWCSDETTTYWLSQPAIPLAG